MKKTLKWLDEHFEETFLCVLLIIITAVMFYGIVMRYVFNSAPAWAEEVCRYCFIYSGFISIGYCVRSNKMLKVDILLDYFPKAVRFALDLLGRVVTLLFFAFTFYSSFGVVKQFISNGLRSSSIDWLYMWAIYIVVPIGFGIATLRSIQDLVRFLGKRDARRGKEVES